MKPVDTAEEAVRGAHVVNTVTNALDPVMKTEWIEPGMFITTVKDSNELELATLERADLVVTNRPGPMWARYPIGGFAGFPEHLKEHWGKSRKIDWDHMPLLGADPSSSGNEKVV